MSTHERERIRKLDGQGGGRLCREDLPIRMRSVMKLRYFIVFKGIASVALKAKKEGERNVTNMKMMAEEYLEEEGSGSDHHDYVVGRTDDEIFLVVGTTLTLGNDDSARTSLWGLLTLLTHSLTLLTPHPHSFPPFTCQSLWVARTTVIIKFPLSRVPQVANIAVPRVIHFDKVSISLFPIEIIVNCCKATTKLD